MITKLSINWCMTQYAFLVLWSDWEQPRNLTKQPIHWPKFEDSMSQIWSKNDTHQHNAAFNPHLIRNSKKNVTHSNNRTHYFSFQHNSNYWSTLKKCWQCGATAATHRVYYVHTEDHIIHEWYPTRGWWHRLYKDYNTYFKERDKKNSMQKSLAAAIKLPCKPL
jgi:hypothetical protein